MNLLLQILRLLLMFFLDRVRIASDGLRNEHDCDDQKLVAIDATPMLKQFCAYSKEQEQEHSIKFISYFVISERKVYEITEEDQSKNLCLMCSRDGFKVQVSRSYLFPGCKFEASQKLSLKLLSPTLPSLKCSRMAASHLLQSPMSFSSENGVRFTVNYTGNSDVIFDLKRVSPEDSTSLLPWDVQVLKSVQSAPEIPSDFQGGMIVLGVLLLNETVVLLGTQRVRSESNQDDFMSGPGSVFFASSSSQGRGHSLFLEVDQRIKTRRRRHYISEHSVGALSSCFYFSKDSRDVALPLTMQKDFFTVSDTQSNAYICGYLLRELNGHFLAQSLMIKKRDTDECKSPFLAGISTKVLCILTPAEQLMFHEQKLDGGFQSSSSTTGFQSPSSTTKKKRVSSSSFSTLPLLSSSSAHSLSTRLVPKHSVQNMLIDAIEKSDTKLFSFKDSYDFVEKLSGKVSISDFCPCQEQVDHFTDPRNRVDVFASVSSAPDNHNSFHVDIDQSVCACTNLESSLLDKIMSSTSAFQTPSSPSSLSSFASKMKSEALAVENEVQHSHAKKLAYSRQSRFGTAVKQLSASLKDVESDQLPVRIIQLILDSFPFAFIFSHTQLDPTLKRVRPYNKKSASKFNQLKDLVSSEFTIVDLGYGNGRAPLRLAVRSPVDCVKECCQSIVHSWRTRPSYSNFPGCTPAEFFCNSSARWGNANHHETVTLSVECLQLGTAVLALARGNKSGTLQPHQINVVFETYNQKASSQFASIGIPETLSYRDYAKYPLDDCCKSTIVTAGESISQIFKESFFNIMLQFFNYKDPVSRCTLSIGMTISSAEVSYVIPTIVIPHSNSLLSGMPAIHMINERSTKSPTAPIKKGDSTVIRCKTSSLFPTLGLPSGLHGAYITLHENPQNMLSIQTYCQCVRYANGLKEIENEVDTCLDVSKLHDRSLVLLIDLMKMFTSTAANNKIGCRTEISFSVQDFSQENITQVIQKALRFKAQNAVPFVTSEIISFSYQWASMAAQLQLLAIECLKDRFINLSDRIALISLINCYGGLLDQFFSGICRNHSVAGYFLEASKVVNFQILPRITAKMFNKIFVGQTPFALPDYRSSDDSDNYHAAGRAKEHIKALSSVRSYFRCCQCLKFFVCSEELHDHLNENPSHKSKSKTNDLVKRPVSEWLDEILESLDQDQKNVVMTFLKGHHIILVSGAGCGKTYVLKRLYRLVMAMYGNEWFLNHVKAIGTTNIIANNLSHLYFQGQTIYSLLGLGSGKRENTVEDFRKTFEQNFNEQRRESILNMRILFGDEAFLFSNLMFAVLFEVLEKVFDSRSCPISMIQCVFAGDPYQMLVHDKDKENLRKRVNGFQPVLRFEPKGESTMMASLLLTGCRFLFLTETHRTTDKRFLDQCNEIRAGKWSQELRKDVLSFGSYSEDKTDLGQLESPFQLLSIDTLPSSKTQRANNAHEIVVPVACIKNSIVDYYNLKGLEAATSTFTLYAYDMNRMTGALTLSQNIILDEIPSSLDLALECPVRILRSVDAFSLRGGQSISKRLPKMSFGVLQSLTFDEEDPRLSTARIRFDIRKGEYWWTDVVYVSEVIDLSISSLYSLRFFMPLSLAYAVTLSSLQGLEFNYLIIDLDQVGTWIRHALYTAITRVRSSKGIKCLNVPSADSDFNNTHPEINALFQKFKSISEKQHEYDSSRKDAFVTLDIVKIIESFQPLKLLPNESVDDQAREFVEAILADI